MRISQSWLEGFAVGMAMPIIIIAGGALISIIGG